MKRIFRLERAPDGLVEYREVERRNPTWDGFRSHREGQAYRELADGLSARQRGLCGYCEIDLVETDRQVEHVVPRSEPTRGRALALAETNLILCCKGGTKAGGNGERRGDPMRENRSCGEAKGDTADPDFLDPREIPAFPSLLRVDTATAEIAADEEACAAAGFETRRVERTIEILRLNAPRLVDNRIAVLDYLRDIWEPHRAEAEIMIEGAREELFTGEETIPRYFTTVRSFFGESAEAVLASAPEKWV